MAKSEIIIKSTEIAETTLSINHTVSNGQSLVIGVKDTEDNYKILLEIKAHAENAVTLNGTITDKRVI